MNDRKKKPYWYRHHIGECPVCGHDKSYRERVYGKKPKNPRRIWVHLPYTETYDYCDQ